MAPPRFQRLLDLDVALARLPQVGLRSLASRARLGEGGQLGLRRHQGVQIGRLDCHRGGLPLIGTKGSQHPWPRLPLLLGLLEGLFGVLLGPGQEVTPFRDICVGVAAVNSSLLGHDGLLSPLIGL